MSSSPLTEVIYREQTFRFAADALGGTRTAPLLKPAEVMLLDWAYATAKAETLKEVTLLHDRAGVLCTCVRAAKKYFVSDNLRHVERMHTHHGVNQASPTPQRFSLLSLDKPGAEINLLHLPKSLELFEQYLLTVARTATPNTRLAAAFQTKYFTPQLLKVAGKYAAKVSQSRAFKKTRLLFLEGFLPVTATRLPMHQVSLAGTVYEQHPGVFSAGHIDYATQFLLEEWSTNPLLLDLPAPESIIDIGCGNGVIGDQLLARYPRAHLTATDVSELALASARHNLRQHGFGERVKVLTASSLAAVLDPALFDLIVTNPPFHDGHQTDISVPLEIFQTASGRLSPAGALVVVANRHLNYLTHLRRYFAEVRIVAENNKFVIYRCR